MNLKIKKGKKRGLEVKENRLDRAIRYVAPVWGQKRFNARIRTAFSAGYTGASRSKNSLKSWNTRSRDSDSDTLLDLGELRSRSSDAIRNNPLAAGIINTHVTNVVGTGLKLKSQIDHKALGMSDEEADEWEENTEREFRIFAESVECDAERKLNFYQKQPLALRSNLERGDYFELMPEIERPGSPYKLKLQSVEADRISNPDNASDTAKLSAGIEVDKNGAMSRIHVRTTHPGSDLTFSAGKWNAVDAFGKKTGRKNFIHLSKTLRPGQRRGIPYLAPVTDVLHQLGEYFDSEATAAWVASLTTIFLESEAGNQLRDGDGIIDTGEALESNGDMNLKSGAIMDLDPGVKANIANPGRPNPAFDQFVLSCLRYIGSALQIPHEIFLGHFTSSFSAARAALNEAWKFFKSQRQWLADCYCRPIYENFMWEAVLSGRIHAPGFISDSAIRKAYLGSDWIGPARGQIKEGEEIRAMKGRLSSFITTIDQETEELTGRSFNANFRQIIKERDALKAAGYILTQENEIQDAAGAQMDAVESN